MFRHEIDILFQIVIFHKIQLEFLNIFLCQLFNHIFMSISIISMHLKKLFNHIFMSI